MTAIAQINAIYECARECEIWDQPVEHHGARAFIAPATALLRELGEASSSDVWRPTALLLRRTRRLICAVPLPFSHPALDLGEVALRLEDQVRRLDRIAGSSQIQVLNAAAAALVELAACDDDPLGCAVRDFMTLDDPASGIVVIAEGYFANPIAASMAGQGVAVPVGTEADLTGRTVFASAAFAGPPSWIRPGMLNAPRARNVVLVHYTFFREHPETQPLLYGPAASSSITRPIRRSLPLRCGGPERQAGQPQVALSRSECSLAEEIMLTLPGLLGRSPASTREPVPARAALLADGSHVLLPITAEHAVVVVHPEFLPNVSAEQVPAREVRQGDYIALRRQNHHQDLIRRADALLGAEAPVLRVTQRLWKDLLWQRVAAHEQGLQGVAEELRKAGASTANVGYWISSWCIRPRSKHDFTVVMHYLGRAAEASKMWQQLSRIDSAHHSAGQRYLKDLQRAFTSQHAERLAVAGWSAITLAGGDGATIVARIEQILPGHCQVPLSTICQLRTSQDTS